MHRSSHTARWAGADQGPPLQPCPSLQPSDSPNWYQSPTIYRCPPLSLSHTPLSIQSYFLRINSIFLYFSTSLLMRKRKELWATQQDQTEIKTNKQQKPNTTYCINVKMEMNGWVYFLPYHLIAVKGDCHSLRNPFWQRERAGEQNFLTSLIPHILNNMNNCTAIIF